MKVSTRDALAELLIEALAASPAAAALRCLSVYAAAGPAAAPPPELRVTDLLRPIAAAERRRVRKRLEACGVLVFEPAGPADRATLAPHFVDDWRQVRPKLTRYAAVVERWSSTPGAVVYTSARDAALHKAALLFDRRLFFEVHEVLEPVWLAETGDTKVFLQGLIQVAVAFYHLERGNLDGARSLLAEGVKKLVPYRPVFLGVELEQFVAGLRICRDALIELRPEHTSEFDERLIPRLGFRAVPDAPARQAGRPQPSPDRRGRSRHATLPAPHPAGKGSRWSG